MCTAFTRACLAVAVLAASGTQVSVFAQSPAGPPQHADRRRPRHGEATRRGGRRASGGREQPRTHRRARSTRSSRTSTAAQVRAAWSPSLNTTVLRNSTVNQNTGFLSGASGDQDHERRS